MLDSHATGRAIGRNNKMLFSEQQPLNDNYMAVIRDSHAAVLSRHELQNERKRILDLDTGCDTRIWNKIKRKKMYQQMSERRKLRQAQTTDDLNVGPDTVNLQV